MKASLEQLEEFSRFLTEHGWAINNDDPIGTAVPIIAQISILEEVLQKAGCFGVTSEPITAAIIQLQAFEKLKTACADLADFLRHRGILVDRAPAINVVEGARRLIQILESQPLPAVAETAPTNHTEWLNLASGVADAIDEIRVLLRAFLAPGWTPGAPQPSTEAEAGTSPSIPDAEEPEAECLDTEHRVCTVERDPPDRIDRIDIVATSNENPSRIARKVHDQLTKIGCGFYKPTCTPVEGTPLRVTRVVGDVAEKPAPVSTEDPGRIEAKFDTDWMKDQRAKADHAAKAAVPTWTDPCDVAEKSLPAAGGIWMNLLGRSMEPVSDGEKITCWELDAGELRVRIWRDYPKDRWFGLIVIAGKEFIGIEPTKTALEMVPEVEATIRRAYEALRMVIDGPSAVGAAGPTSCMKGLPSDPPTDNKWSGHGTSAGNGLIGRAFEKLGAELDRTRKDQQDLKSQIGSLSKFIIEHNLMPQGFEGGAVDCAIQIMDSDIKTKARLTEFLRGQVGETTDPVQAAIEVMDRQKRMIRELLKRLRSEAEEAPLGFARVGLTQFSIPVAPKREHDADLQNAQPERGDGAGRQAQPSTPTTG